MTIHISDDSFLWRHRLDAAAPLKPNPGEYIAGPWHYVYQVHRAGARGERRQGRLTLNGKAPGRARPHDRVFSPWGIMRYIDDERNSGWFLASPDQPGRVHECGRLLVFDEPPFPLDRFGLYTHGRWTYAYAPSNPGLPNELRCGRLFYESKLVEAREPDSIIQTPWGFMAWCADAHNTGWLLRLAGDEPVNLEGGPLVVIAGATPC